MVFITGEEMTHYAMNLVRRKCIDPYLDTSQWEYFDLSVKNRDKTGDKVLHDAVEAGARIGAIFKEPTITPTSDQREEMGLKHVLGSPNGAMRRGWNGFTISRDTIMIEGIQLGFAKPVFFERHAVGGEYGAGYGMPGKGVLKTMFYPDGKVEGAVELDSRTLTDDVNAAVTYHNPLDNIEDLAHHFFTRCLVADITPYVVTKKTVFKWQEEFWAIMKRVFDEHYKDKYLEAGILQRTGNELQHLISDAATMQIIRWHGGGFGMAAHNYDGDMLTDEVAQMHRSPGFITSNLIGKTNDGRMIKEYEASHGTVADLWHMHLRGEETSFNPLGMIEAVIGSIQHAATLDASNQDAMMEYTTKLRQVLHRRFVVGQGTRDMQGPDGLTTEAFIDCVADRLNRVLNDLPRFPKEEEVVLTKPSKNIRRNYNIDEELVKEMFAKYDLDKDGSIDYAEFEELLVDLDLAPKKLDDDIDPRVVAEEK
jgi:isocitrate dehydrogenase